MKRKLKPKGPLFQKNDHDHPRPGEISPRQKQLNAEAHRQADKDMMEDAELTSHSPNDDLDEGETARLGENKTDLI